MGVSAGGTWKRKNRGVPFPVLEQHFVEWVDRANEQHVVVSNDILRTTTEELISVLVAQIPNLGEDYADFAMSNRWLSNIKNRHSITVRSVAQQLRSGANQYRESKTRQETLDRRFIGSASVVTVRPRETISGAVLSEHAKK